MSAIVGLVRFDGRPVVRGDIERMAEPLRHWGSERSVWHDAQAGLGLLADLRTPQPTVAPTILRDGSVVVAIGRLDNGKALADELGLIATAIAANAPSSTAIARDAGDAGDADDAATDSHHERGADGAIIAAAWERWRDDAPRRLHGDWSFAAWTPGTRRLFLARDPFGNTALSYHQHADFFAFGSSARALFAAGVPRRLNELRLAQHLASWITDGEATLHEGVLRLPPGCHLTVDDRRVEVKSYWFPENLPDIRLSSPEAYVERFLELYDDAVRARLRTSGGAAVALSSGLDSGSVTALAARHLRARGRSLIAFTSVPLHAQIANLTRGTVDEWELAHATAEWAGYVDHRRITAPDVTPLAAIERSLGLHDEPEFASPNLHWMTAMFDAARENGATVLLTGQLGNGGISWAGDQQRVLRGLTRFRWIDAWQGLREAQRLLGGSILRAIWTQIVLPLRARRSAAQFRRGLLAPPATRMIAPEFADRMRIAERMREAGYDPYFGSLLPPRAQRLRYLLPGVTPFGAVWAETSAGFGIDVRDPTADVRLLEFCLSIPDAVYRDAHYDRLLVRRAMEGLLPPSVQWNRRRGRQAADLAFRLRDDADVVGDAVRTVVNLPLARETLNVGAVLDAWARVRSDVTRASANESFTLIRLLHIGMFLTGL